MEVGVFHGPDAHDAGCLLNLLGVEAGLPLVQAVQASRLRLAQQRFQRHRIPGPRSETFPVLTLRESLCASVVGERRIKKKKISDAQKNPKHRKQVRDACLNAERSPLLYCRAVVFHLGFLHSP